MNRALFFLLAILIISSVSGIYDGDVAKSNQFPYSVLVRQSGSFCGGSLISDRFILTAAHCLMEEDVKEVKVDIGGYGEHIISTKFWMHENFTMPSAIYDIGIIELPEPFNDVRPVKISTKTNVDLDPEDDEVIVSGWGYQRSHRSVARKLLYTNMKLISLEECQKFKSHYIEDMNENHICMKKIKGMPCDGDSGTSLISKKTGKIVGVLSYVKDAENGEDIHYNDCRTDVPAVSTRISSYLDWITKKTGLKFDDQEESNADNEETKPKVVRPRKKEGYFQWISY